MMVCPSLPSLLTEPTRNCKSTLRGSGLTLHVN